MARLDRKLVANCGAIAKRRLKVRRYLVKWNWSFEPGAHSAYSVDTRRCGNPRSGAIVGLDEDCARRQ